MINNINFFECKKILQSHIQNYQNKLYNEILNYKHMITSSNIVVKSVHGIKSKIGNDRTDYMWIKVIIDNNKEYWLSLFYNDIDENTGNMHTQIGRIQFWKNIHDKTPNNYINIGNKKIWYLNTENSDEPKKGATFVGDEITDIISDFIVFINNDIKSK